ncbi:NUDIX domain-containing protein [Candidatus Paracaedibacter symbiosus]|uniref:NUDIX domain-containing protein n=1 Tax=Candidatus Paracaedibacter symbiosus TaxID=244582 RepID=UPI000509B824|nr:NUDIX domain-containing protein [Candidatus Paracaedibacter symbiosus]
MICHSMVPTFPQLRRAPTSKIFAGHWHLPTGKIEEGESPRNTIIREGREQIGTSVSPNLATVVFI